MGDSEEVPCGACCELVDRTCEWYFCDSCGDALHHPASCNDVWHPHENLHFCNKKCASAVLKSQRVVFVLQQRMPPAPSPWRRVPAQQADQMALIGNQCAQLAALGLAVEGAHIGQCLPQQDVTSLNSRRGLRSGETCFPEALRVGVVRSKILHAGTARFRGAR